MTEPLANIRAIIGKYANTELKERLAEVEDDKLAGLVTLIAFMIGWEVTGKPTEFTDDLVLMNFCLEFTKPWLFRRIRDLLNKVDDEDWVNAKADMTFVANKMLPKIREHVDLDRITKPEPHGDVPH
jgi:hypothetical protein